MQCYVSPEKIQGKPRGLQEASLLLKLNNQQMLTNTLAVVLHRQAPRIVHMKLLKILYVCQMGVIV